MVDLTGLNDLGSGKKKKKKKRPKMSPCIAISNAEGRWFHLWDGKYQWEKHLFELPPKVIQPGPEGGSISWHISLYKNMEKKFG